MCNAPWPLGGHVSASPGTGHASHATRCLSATIVLLADPSPARYWQGAPREGVSPRLQRQPDVGRGGAERGPSRSSTILSRKVDRGTGEAIWIGSDCARSNITDSPSSPRAPAPRRGRGQNQKRDEEQSEKSSCLLATQ
jgi:hypothetical protein